MYYPFNGVPIAMKSGSAGTLTYLHHDHLGSLIAASNPSGTEIGSARYLPFGIQRSAPSTGTNPTGLPSDRLFTGQIRDLGNDAYYFFKSRYYDATIGKFQTGDTMVPGAGNPRALNRYAYGLNNPLRFVDPSGHDALPQEDQKWIDSYMKGHFGRTPTVQDWKDYLFSQANPGSGKRGSWTSIDWNLLSGLERGIGDAAQIAWKVMDPLLAEGRRIGASAVGAEFSFSAGLVEPLGFTGGIDVLYNFTNDHLAFYAMVGGGVAAGESSVATGLFVFNLSNDRDFNGPFVGANAKLAVGLGYQVGGFRSFPGAGDVWGFTTSRAVGEGVSGFAGITSDALFLTVDFTTQQLLFGS